MEIFKAIEETPKCYHIRPTTMKKNLECVLLHTMTVRKALCVDVVHHIICRELRQWWLANHATSLKDLLRKASYLYTYNVIMLVNRSVAPVHEKTEDAQKRIRTDR